MATAKTSPKNKPTKAKKTTKKKVAKKPKLELVWNPAEKLTLNEELFCRYYVLNEKTRRNGTRSYDAAYDKKLEEQPTDDEVWDEVPSDIEGAPPQRKLIQASSYRRCENYCATEANRLLRKPKISKRITELLNELLTDEFVDGELTKVISQDDDLNPKVRGIQEYNKMKKRTVDTVEHTHSFAKYDEMSDEELDKAIASGEKFFKKA